MIKLGIVTQVGE